MAYSDRERKFTFAKKWWTKRQDINITQYTLRSHCPQNN